MQLSEIISQIAFAAEESGRHPQDVRLLAVSKTHGEDKILPLLQAGQRLFGENRVQEAAGKWPALKEKYPDARLHLIGPLQTNKVREAVALFDAVETVDRPELAEKLAKEMEKQDRHLPCFIQVNTGEEPQKAGVHPKETAGFVKYCQNIGLNIIGLMCIPPVEDEPSAHFAFLKKLAGQSGLKELSMGMSDDFPYAVQQGATIVRVGSALFGWRDYSK